MDQFPRFATRSKVAESSNLTIFEAHTVLTEGDVADFTLAMPLPKGWRYRLPGVSEIATEERNGSSRAISSEALRGGLRFPLHRFIREILHIHRLLPCQLHPNAYTLMVAYIIRCGQLGAQPFKHVWYHMFMLHYDQHGYYGFKARPRKNKDEKFCVVVPRSNVHAWKVKFLLVEAPNVREWGTPESGEVRMEAEAASVAVLTAPERDVLDVFRASAKREGNEWYKVVTLTNLDKYFGIVPHPNTKEVFEKYGALYSLSAMAEKAAVLGWERTEEGGVAAESSAVAELRPASPPQTLPGPVLRKRKGKGKEAMAVVKDVEMAPPAEEEHEDEDDTPLIKLKKLRVSSPALTEKQRVEDEGVGETQAAKKSAEEVDPMATAATGQEIVEYTGGGCGEVEMAERSPPSVEVLVAEDVEMRAAEVMGSGDVPAVVEEERTGGVAEVGAPSSSAPPQEPTGGNGETFVIPPWRLPPGFGVLGQFKDRAKNDRARLEWLRGVASASDVEKLRRGSDEAFYHWYLRNTVQVPLVNGEMLCRMMEKDRVLAEQREALAKAEEEIKRLKTNNVALMNTVREMSDNLSASLADLAKERDEGEACKMLNTELKDQVASLQCDFSVLSALHGEAQQKIKDGEGEIDALGSQVASLESENGALKKLYEDSQVRIEEMNEKSQALIKGHEAEVAEMKAIICKNRVRRQELQETLAKEEVYYARAAIKTKGFEDAIDEVALEWYEAGFDVAKKQAEAAMDLGETEVDWDGERTMGVELPKFINFPTTWIPVRPADAKPPTVLLEEWEAEAGDEVYVVANDGTAPAS